MYNLRVQFAVPVWAFEHPFTLRPLNLDKQTAAPFRFPNEEHNDTAVTLIIPSRWRN